jgi:hypothetical protein
MSKFFASFTVRASGESRAEFAYGFFCNESGEKGRGRMKGAAAKESIEEIVVPKARPIVVPPF